ncbi:molybdopterin molybdotransferase MoeA [Sphingomonas immobilis]|uniref:Molybdopterin molybdenumtransferase n=1 Tax=Sphingomonas immobilis TaxID=3063997 RepID=A0ABT8ZZK2_9SPHN|nr:molybdopterin molybdotransferase MoeA [Sphingomonas sp. CA1-15]MDO7841882.1 molybdopterin molybdotransferase MoeA [Sphingomonas sp. CA1-15]
MATLPGSASDCEALIAYDAAQSRLATHSIPLGIERASLAKAGRRAVAEAVYARIDSPRADTAAMDGYAVRNADIDTGQRAFPVTGTHFAGGASTSPLTPGSAVRIMTGAPLPAGADRVVMLEQVRLEGDRVILPQTLSAKVHVRRRASDFAAGDTLLKPGRVIDPRALLIAAAADVAELAVWRRPRVGFLSTGDELTDPGNAAATTSDIPDCLAEAVALLARQWGAKPAGAARVADDAEAIRGAAEGALADCNVLVVIGGASRGDRDFARLALLPLGLDLVFADVAIKPGKPVWYGRIGAQHVLGLPGNPTAAMTVARLFLAPLLTGLDGRGTDAALVPTMLPLADDAPTAIREQFLCGHADGAGVRIIERQMASSQAMLRNADMIVRIPGGAAPSPAGTSVATFRF